MMLEFIVCYCWVLYCVGMFFLVILTLDEYLLIYDKERGCITEERKDILNVNELNTSDDEVAYTKEMGDYEETIEDAPKGSFFYGKKVVISGVFREVGRNQLAKVLQMRGADVNICVSKRTDILICGKNCGWSKVEKAEKYGVRMIDEDELLKIMDNDDMICNDDSVKEDESIIVA